MKKSEDLIKQEKETKRVTRKIIYLYDDGTPVKDKDGKAAIGLQWAEFTRTKKLDIKNGRTVCGPWPVVTFDSLDVISVPGYKTDTPCVPAVENVSPDNLPPDFKVVFYRLPEVVDLKDEQWVFLRDGEPDHDYSGLATAVDGTVVYVTKGLLDNDYCGLIQGKDKKWVYLKNGIINKKYTGIAKSTNGRLYFVRNGLLDVSYTGIAPGEDGKWYYVKEGRHIPDFIGIAKSVNGRLYFVSDGIWNTNYTGIAPYSDGKWYYVEKGKHVPSYNGIARSINGKLYYVNKGVWDTSFSGSVKDTDGITYNVKNGRV